MHPTPATIRQPSGSLDDLRASNPSLAGLDDADYDIRMAYAQALQKRATRTAAMSSSARRSRSARTIRPRSQARTQIILAKNYAIMEQAWGKDDDAGIKALEENMLINPDFRETRQKLYALLIMKADRLIGAGERDAAFEVLMRALQVLPDEGEAQKRLAAYTPTPMPTATPAAGPGLHPAVTQPARPGSRPPSRRQQQSRPASQPSGAAGCAASKLRGRRGQPASSSCPGGVCP